VAEVRAEMVANVWKVLVSEGDHVDEGDTLVILESMKMEIPILAEESSTVTTLHVAEGDVVQEDDLIAELGLPPGNALTEGATRSSGPFRRKELKNPLIERAVTSRRTTTLRCPPRPAWARVPVPGRPCTARAAFRPSPLAPGWRGG
jgi:acetyl-CoA carboxylase biotin carboxyl carrier protein